MKPILLFSTLCIGIAVVGCGRSNRAALDDTASKPKAANSARPVVDAVEGGKSGDTTNKTESPVAKAKPVTPGERDPSDSISYADKETYPHAGKDGASMGAIAGGTGQSGGAPIAPSATAIDAGVKEWHLSAAELQTELNRGTNIVRTKEIATGAPVDDEALHTLVNNRLMADPETVQIDTQMEVKNGEVAIQGDVASLKLMGRAIAIVLDTEGVTKVTSGMKFAPSPSGTLQNEATGIPVR